VSWMDNESRRALKWRAVWERFTPLTPMGQRAKKALSPFMPGEERAWNRCLDEQERILARLEQDQQWERRVREPLSRLPDAEPVVSELECGGVPPMAGWFRLNVFLWVTRELLKAWSEVNEGSFPDEERIDALLQILHPGTEIGPTFTLDDAFDPRLSHLRREVAQWERERMAAEEEQAGKWERTYGVRRNREGEWIVDRDSGIYPAMQHNPHIKKVRETPFEGVFRPLPTERVQHAMRRRHQAVDELEQVEREVLISLAAQMRPQIDFLKQLLSTVVHMDLQWARVRVARGWHGVRPRLDREVFQLEGGVHPVMGEALLQENRPFTPLDVTLLRGATVVIGPNMGGKTVALKTVGLLAALGQYGFFVPARRCCMPLFPWIRTVIGDGQDERDGLSSFAAEVVRLTEAMNQSESGLLLLDEIGRGTNPDEGAALAAAVAEVLAECGKWSFLSTHVKEVLEVAGVRVYRMAGLKEPGMWNPDGKFAPMDYRLLPGGGEGVPRQALRIAEGLGMPAAVCQRARRRIGEGESDGSEAAIGRTGD
jgi:DNA mismatch repair protein MutS2